MFLYCRNKGNEKDRQKNKLSLVVCMDRSALVLLVSKPLQEEIISPTIDIDNYVSDMSGKKKVLIYLTALSKSAFLPLCVGTTGTTVIVLPFTFSLLRLYSYSLPCLQICCLLLCLSYCNTGLLFKLLPNLHAECTWNSARASCSLLFLSWF